MKFIRTHGNGLEEVVAPLAGAWIEMQTTAPKTGLADPSLPSRERGLKYCLQDARRPVGNVAPLAGAWIEIVIHIDPTGWFAVAPLAGAWIEIFLF